MIELKEKCPVCGETKSGKTYLTDGIVRCWECKTLSNWENWFKK